MEEGRCRQDLEARLARAEKQRAQRAQERLQVAVTTAQRLRFVGEMKAAKKARLAEKIADDLEAAERKRQGMLDAERERLAAAHELVQNKLQEVHRKEWAQAAELHQRVKSKLEAAQAKRSALLAAVVQRAMQANSKAEQVAARARARQEQASCIKVQRAWRAFVRERRTTCFLASKLRSLEVSRSHFACVTFDQMAVKLQARDTLGAARCFLARAACKLEALAKAPSSREALATAPSSSNKACDARMLLSAFMVDLHPQVVLSERGEHERGLRRDAHRLVAAFDRLVLQCTHSSSKLEDSSSESAPGPTDPAQHPLAHQHVPPTPGQSLPSPAPKQPRPPSPPNVRAALLELQGAWEAYLPQFAAWKSRDELCMEEEMVRAACAMEASMLTKTLRASPPLSPANKHALEHQVATDHQLLRERIMKLTGQEGVARMESQLARVRAEVVEATAEAACTVAAPPALPASSPSPASASAAADSTDMESLRAQEEDRDLHGTSAAEAAAWTNERMVYELLHDPHWQLPLNITDNAAACASLPGQVERAMEQAFWDVVESELHQRPPALQHVLLLVAELRDAVADVAPSQRRRAGEVLCPRKVTAALEGPEAAASQLHTVLEEAAHLFASLRAPVRDEDAERELAQLRSQLQALDPTEAHWVARSVVAGMKFLFAQLRTLQRDVANAHLRALGPLAASDAGVECARQHFARRLGLPPASADKPANKHARAASADEEAAQRGEETRHVLANALSRTRLFLQDAAAYLQEVECGPSALEASELAGPEKLHAQAPATLRTGIRGSAASGGSAVLRREAGEGGVRDRLLRAGLVQLTRAPSATPSHLLPETLSMEADRIEWAQNQFQLALVTAACCLMVRQNAPAQLDVTRLSTRVHAMLRDPEVRCGRARPVWRVTLNSRVGIITGVRQPLGFVPCNLAALRLSVVELVRARFSDEALSARSAHTMYCEVGGCGWRIQHPLMVVFIRTVD
mmetsp:Transcript_44121/g.84316  ORF Transcript_44121/g.84316 Transcript_44121/m.84316 type:complete len:982 (+) Transcript_44121:116-3061(+)